jgi:predicted metal-binding transcription factor (methanogenesis marker protein 9)
MQQGLPPIGLKDVGISEQKFKAPKKELTEEEAIRILDEAGGDKQRAIQIARERGYSVPELGE